MKALWLIATSAPLLLAGCAQVDPRPDYQRAADTIARTTGQPADYRPGDDESVAAKVAELLDGGISTDDAARVALLNNPALQAAFLDIGLARADVVQSGLMANPSLGLAMRLPAGGGLAGIEADLAQNIADLWQIPVRKRAAQRVLDRTILEVAAQAAEVVAEAKTRYHAVLGADERLTIAEKNRDIARTVLELTEYRRGAGAASELDVNLARGVLLEAQLAIQHARLEAADARRALAEMLGLSDGAATLVLTDSLPEPPADTPDVETLVDMALEQRLEIRAARDAVAAAEQNLELEYRRVLPSLELGLAVERGERGRAEDRDLLADTARSSIAAGRLAAPEIEPRSARRTSTDFSIGPSLSLELPIFDQNQAQIARARYELEQARKLLAGLEISLSQEVRGALDQALTAWEVARFYREEVLPQAQRNLDLSRSTYEAGKTSILSMLDAERTYLAARDSDAAAFQAAAQAVPALERAVGRPFAELRTSAGTENSGGDAGEHGKHGTGDEGKP